MIIYGVTVVERIKNNSATLASSSLTLYYSSVALRVGSDYLLIATWLACQWIDRFVQ